MRRPPAHTRSAPGPGDRPGWARRPRAPVAGAPHPGTGCAGSGSGRGFWGFSWTGLGLACVTCPLSIWHPRREISLSAPGHRPPTSPVRPSIDQYTPTQSSVATQLIPVHPSSSQYLPVHPSIAQYIPAHPSMPPQFIPVHPSTPHFPPPIPQLLPANTGPICPALPPPSPAQFSQSHLGHPALWRPGLHGNVT